MADAWDRQLDEGIERIGSLASAHLPAETAEAADLLLALSHLLRLRARTGQTIPLIGILGSASSGKSTLFNALAGRAVSRVTPIPHQTTGAIAMVPETARAIADDPGFLRPAAERVETPSADPAGLTGSPAAATVVIDAADRGFVLIDLPDIGTVQSSDERDVALRVLPWLDRAILLVTEETFAQEEHERLARVRLAIHPERARPDLYLALNRAHTKTTDESIAARLESVGSFWPEAPAFTLPHLKDGRTFTDADVEPLTAECHARVTRYVRDAVRRLATDVAERFGLLARVRREAARKLDSELARQIGEAGRFRRDWLGDEFRRQLDAASPWKNSLKRFRQLLGATDAPAAPSGTTPDLLSADALTRHVEQAAERLAKRIDRTLAQMTGDDSVCVAPPDAAALAGEVRKLAAEINERARKDLETILTALKEEQAVKRPVLRALTAGAGSLFFLDLMIPTVGTISTLAVTGLLSTLGLGMVTADVVRMIRESRLRERIEGGVSELLNEERDRMLASEPMTRFDLTDEAKKLAAWAKRLPEA